MVKSRCSTAAMAGRSHLDPISCEAQIEAIQSIASISRHSGKLYGVVQVSTLVTMLDQYLTSVIMDDFGGKRDQHDVERRELRGECLQYTPNSIIPLIFDEPLLFRR